MKLSLFKVARLDASTRPLCKSGHINYIVTYHVTKFDVGKIFERECVHAWLQIIATGNL